MQKLIKNVLSHEDCEALCNLAKTEKKRNPVLPDGIFAKIQESINSEIKVSWEHPSYYRLENIGRSHGWHVDTGDTNQMSWCDYGCSILLNPVKDAGFLQYRDGLKLSFKEHYGNIAIHSSDIEHRTIHQPFARVTFLAFLKSI